jgi:GH25 family lysozyme M1 (1,4-beta-N-acetylmuramidase)
VDVSDYQHTVDWHKVKGSGVDFAYAQAADGDGYADSTFKENWKGIKAAGMLRGAYQYFEPSQSPDAQADLLIARIKDAGGVEDGDLPPALDIETAGGESGGTIASRAVAWAKRIEDKLHQKPVFYISPGFFSGIGSPGSLTKFDLWEADWGVSCPGVPSGFHGFAFWQYSDSASVPGISGHVDADRFDGSLSDLKKYAGDNGSKGPSLSGEEGTIGIAELDDNGATDVNGDGRADACAFNGTSVNCYLSHGDAFADHPIEGPELPKDERDKVEFYSTLRFADINGDHKSDVCYRGKGGVVCWLSDGHGFGKAIHTGKLSDKDGFDDPKNYSSIRLADVNGDGKADLCARTNKTFKCWLATGHGFDQVIDGPDWAEKGGSFDKESHWATIRMADIDGDGRADVCARTHTGVECWLSNGHGFPDHVSGPELDDKAWDDADNWTTLRFADINGDKKADLCLRRNGGISCWHSLGNKFGHEIKGPELSSDHGWDKFDNYSTLRLADVDGDGRADLCGRKNKGLTCWLSEGDHFGPAIESTMLSDDAHGDRASHYRTLRFADVDGDGRQDLCFRNESGLSCHLANASGGFGKVIPGPAWSDKNGWDAQRRYGTIMINGD